MQLSRKSVLTTTDAVNCIALGMAHDDKMKAICADILCRVLDVYPIGQKYAFFK